MGDKPTKPCGFEACRNRADYGRKLCSGHRYQERKGQALAPLRYNRTTQEALQRTDDGEKLCLKCREWKPENEFDADTRNTDGLRQSCKVCRRLATIERKFHVSPARYYAMLAEQGGRCAICRRPSGGERGWHIDHDHACCPERGRSCGNCVRGLLCGKCNVGLAMFEDSPDALAAAITYLSAGTVR